MAKHVQNELSFIYSETSEVENMSLALGIGLLMQPELCFLDEMDQADMSVLLTYAIHPSSVIRLLVNILP